MNNIITIWKKELMDAIRDKRTLMAMIILPIILMPIIVIGMSVLVESQIKKAEEQTVKVGIVYGTEIDLAQLINQNETIDLVQVDGNLNEAVKDRSVDAGLVLPKDYQSKINSYQTVDIKIIKHSVNEKSSYAVNRIKVIVAQYNQQLINSRLVNEDVNQKILSTVLINEEELATEKELGGFGLGFILPLFIVMWSIVGGQYIATDISAGEKERKTLESLLLTPARRIEIVFGKYFAVATSALISVVVSLTSMYFAVKYFGTFGLSEDGGATSALGISADFSIEPMALFVMFVVSVLMVLMFSAVILSIAIFAKSYKEAQSYIGPSYLVVILPVSILNSLPGFEPALWFFALPAVNSVLLFKEILIGTYDLGHILVTLISLAVFSVIAIYIASQVYQKEGVLFKE